jgi:hypothetical protein
LLFIIIYIFRRLGKLIATVHFKTKEDAMFSYIDHHEQPINGGDMKLVPKKLDGRKKEKEKGEAMPDKPKALTLYNPAEYDYLHMDVKKIPVGSNKTQVQLLFKNGKVVTLEPDPLNPKNLMVSSVTFDTREGAIEDYKNTLGKKLNGMEIVVVPQKLGEGGPKSRKSKFEPGKESEPSVTEEVTYEVIKKPKKRKSKNKSVTKEEDLPPPPPEVVEEVTYEVIKKPKKSKSDIKDVKK